jgi:DNA-binding beta-propeller fold protein YncE
MDNVITSIAGNGNQGYSGDGSSGIIAMMDNPFHVDINSTNTYLYIADCFNFRIRRLNLKTNSIETYAGTGNQGHSGDGGLAINADIDEIYAIQVDINGDLYLCQRFNPSIRKIDSITKIITTVAGTTKEGSGKDHIPAIESEMIEPNDCILDQKRGLLIADIHDQRIRRLDLGTGIITTFAGNGKKEHSGDNGQATNAAIYGARAVSVDQKGNTYICEREGNTLRRVDINGIITTVAGTGEHGYSGDGDIAISATFNGPKAIRCDKKGNILIVDTENHAIRKLDITSNKLSTIAGGQVGAHGDGGNALEAGLARPHGIVVDTNGVIYIADSENHRIRIVN